MLEQVRVIPRAVFQSIGFGGKFGGNTRRFGGFLGPESSKPPKKSRLSQNVIESGWNLSENISKLKVWGLKHSKLDLVFGGAVANLAGNLVK